MEYIFGLDGNSLWAALVVCVALLFGERRVNIQKNDNALLQADLVKAVELSCRDQLTKLLNRRGLEEWLIKIVTDAERKDETFCFVLLDIDHFKRINDTYGHDAGDMVLVALADLIRGGVLRTGDVRVRWGGEELLIVMPSTNARTAVAVVERLRQVIESLRLEVLKGEKVTVSAGVAEYRPDEEPSKTISRADAALYEAKAAGRNQVVVAEQTLTE